MFQFTENPDEKRLNEENLKMHDKLYLRDLHSKSINDQKYKYTKEKEEHNLEMEMILALTQPDFHHFPKSDFKELKVNAPARYIKSDKLFKKGPSTGAKPGERGRRPPLPCFGKCKKISLNLEKKY